VSYAAGTEERNVIRDLLPPLALLAAYLFGRGLLYMLDHFVRAIFGTLTRSVGWIPILGHVVTAPIHTIEQKVSHLIGTATQALDKRIGTSYHKLAGVIRHLGSTLAQQALMGLLIAASLANFITHGYFLRVLRVVLHPLRALQHETAARLHDLQGVVRGLDRLVLHKVWPLVRAIEGELAHTLEDVIPGLHAFDHFITRRLEALWRWLRHRKLTLTTGAFLGAFAWALGRLGVGWIRCSKWRKIGPKVCRNDWTFLGDLFGVALAAELVIDPEAVANAALKLEELFESSIHELAD
jgi:hypothetical protein